jgi:hypothetical protein
VSHSGKRLASPSARESTQRRVFLNISIFPHNFSSTSASLARVPWTLRHSGKPLFLECISSSSATLGEEFLPRVPDIWHSGKPGALGEFPFSRSGWRCRQQRIPGKAFAWSLGPWTWLHRQRAASHGHTAELSNQRQWAQPIATTLVCTPPSPACVTNWTSVVGGNDVATQPRSLHHGGRWWWCTPSTWPHQHDLHC